MNTSKFWKFWTVEVLTITALIAMLFHFGGAAFILANDCTYITFINIFIMIACSALVGWQIHKGINKGSEIQWFMADAVLSLGMIGTLVGFLMVLYSVFTGIDVNSEESMRKAIEVLAVSMGTALITSLGGLVASIVMKIQLIILEEK